jgi:hypothetical protein
MGGRSVIGAVISMTSTEGNDFITNEIIVGDPSLLGYMTNATGGENFDIKNRGIGDKPDGMTPTQYQYRGSNANGKIGSARDFGNLGAGIVAGRKGFSCGASRIAFDALESFQQKKIATERTPTQKAQKIGHSMGRTIRELESK